MLVWLTSCSGLSTLTPQMMDEAEMKWKTSKPTTYRLVVRMEGDRVDRSEYDVRVKDGVVTSLTRNGAPTKSATGGQDYSMDGLFKVIREEMELAVTPSKLGAPEGYSAYLMARFDATSGRLLKYRRAIGGANNSIDIVVLSFEPGG